MNLGFKAKRYLVKVIWRKNDTVFENSNVTFSILDVLDSQDSEPNSGQHPVKTYELVFLLCLILFEKITAYLRFSEKIINQICFFGV